MTKLSELEPGDRLVAEAGMPCLKAGEVYEVIEVEQALAVTCRHGPHVIAVRWYFERYAHAFVWVRPAASVLRRPRDDDCVLVGFRRAVGAKVA